MKACNLTLCLTIGRRPELLRQTLQSLLDKVEFADIIAINDFRDEETNQVFRELCPEGLLINLPTQVGHHKAVDEMYSKVQTEYIFHCEDDWLFDQPIEFEKYIKTLKKNPKQHNYVSANGQIFLFQKNKNHKFNLLNLLHSI